MSIDQTDGVDFISVDEASGDVWLTAIEDAGFQLKFSLMQPNYAPVAARHLVMRQPPWSRDGRGYDRLAGVIAPIIDPPKGNVATLAGTGKP